jgi:hypothetical protein
MEPDEIEKPESTVRTSKPKKFRWFLGMFFLGLAGLLFFSNLEFLRQPISKALSKATGLDIQFSSIKFSDGLGIQLEGVEVKTKNESKNLFSSQKLILTLDWKPLLDGEIKILHAALIQPILKINLKVPPKKSALLPQRGQITRTRFNFAPEAFQVIPVTASATSDRGNRWTNLQAKLKNVYLDVRSLEIDHGKLVFIGEEYGLTVETPISVSADLSLQRSSLENLDLKTSRLEFSSGSLFVKSQLDIVNILSPSTEIRFQAHLDDFKVARLNEMTSLFSESMQKWIAKNADGSAGKIELVAKIISTADPNASPPLLDGHLDIANLILPGKENALTVRSIQTTFNAPAPDRAMAQTTADQIISGQTSFESVRGELEWKDDQVLIKRATLSPRNGSLNFNGVYQPQASRYDFDFSSDALRIEDFVGDKAKGPIIISGNLHGTLPRSTSQKSRWNSQSGEKSIFQEMNGNAIVVMNDGKFPSLELIGTVMHLLDPNEETEMLKRGLAYQSLGGDFEMTRGIVSSANLALITDRLHVRANGKINLPEQTVNAQVRGLPLKLLEQMTGPLPDFGPLLKKSGLQEAVYLKIEGPVQAPRLILTADAKALIKPEKLLRDIFDLSFSGR